MKRSLRTACALCLLAAAAAGAAPDGDRLEARLRHATSALDGLRGNLDPRAHAEAARAVDALAREAPGNPRGLALRAWLAMNRHEFVAALDLAERALAGAPRDAVALALRADALTELGRYPEAIAAAEALDEAGVTTPALVRIAHLRRLHGDLAGAVELVEQALRRPSGSPRDHDWLVRELAALRWHGGFPRAALDLLSGLPQDEVETLALSASILESAGLDTEAHGTWRRAAAAAPLPSALLGQWRTATEAGERRRLAHQLRGLARLDESQGGLSRRDFVEFHALSGRLADAETLARKEYQRRPDVFSAGQLAWVLALGGQREEALARSREATRLGTIDHALAAQLGTVSAGPIAGGARH